jgi:2-oxoglutarate ferredoxin oxidoreductase subunit beta
MRLVADPDKKIIVVGGDGDGMAIGAGHFLHAARRNPNITYIMMDNEIYGLTKGQVSPTSELGLKTKSTPYVDIERSADWPLNPLSVSIVAGATFAARAYSGKIKELVDIIGRAMDHEGYSFVQAISPCVTFNDIYERARAENREISPDHDPSDRAAALTASMGDPFVTGVFFEERRQTLEEAIALQQNIAKPKADTGLAGLAMKILANAA